MIKQKNLCLEGLARFFNNDTLGTLSWGGQRALSALGLG